MNKIFNNMKKSDGYVSVETIIIGGLLATLGTFLVLNFNVSSQELTFKSETNIDNVDYEGMLDFKGKEV